MNTKRRLVFAHVGCIGMVSSLTELFRERDIDVVLIGSPGHGIPEYVATEFPDLTVDGLTKHLCTDRPKVAERPLLRDIDLQITPYTYDVKDGRTNRRERREKERRMKKK